MALKVVTNMIEAHICRKNNEKLEYLCLKRAKNQRYPGLWQMVTGSIDEGEKAYQTAAREIIEETGIEVKEITVVPHVNSFYDPKHDAVSLIPVFMVEVPEDTQVTLSEEHSEYIWADAERAKPLFAWEGQRKSVDIIEQYHLHENIFMEKIIL